MTIVLVRDEIKLTEAEAKAKVFTLPAKAGKTVKHTVKHATRHRSHVRKHVARGKNHVVHHARHAKPVKTHQAGVAVKRS